LETSIYNELALHSRAYGAWLYLAPTALDSRASAKVRGEL